MSSWGCRWEGDTGALERSESDYAHQSDDITPAEGGRGLLYDVVT